jgi:cell wall-associated NlpC family hydrolase
MGIPMRDAIAREALSWIGTPYKKNCWLKGRGADCAMMAQEVFINVGLIKERFSVADLDTDWMVHGTRELLLEKIQKVVNDNSLLKAQFLEPEAAMPLQVGDILMFSLFKTRLAHHVSIFVGDDMMVHCVSHGVMKQQLNHMWIKRMTKVLRWELK